MYTTESKLSVGNPNFLSKDCPLADCNDTNKNFVFLSLLIMKLTNLLHRLQNPSNNKIFSLLIIDPIKEVFLHVHKVQFQDTQMERSKQD